MVANDESMISRVEIAPRTIYLVRRKRDANDYYDMQLKDKPYSDRNSLGSTAPVLALAVNWLKSFLYASRGATHASKLILAACLLAPNISIYSHGK